VLSECVPDVHQGVAEGADGSIIYYTPVTVKWAWGEGACKGCQ